MEIKIIHKGEDYIAVEINGVEKELRPHDGIVIEMLLKTIKTLFKAYS